jgi:hypothetical protein
MQESSVGQRFMQLIQQLGLSKNAFAMSLDKTATVIQHLVDERNKPGFDLMCKVFEVYPNVSKDWLLLGKGPMLLADANAPLAAAATFPAATANLVSSASAASVQPLAAPAATATPHFPEPLFPVSAARPALPEEAALPIVPAAASISKAAPVPAPEAAAVSAPQRAATPALGAVALEVPPAAPLAAPGSAPAVPDAAALTAALHAQYLQHQLALAEQRNQHLLEQQALMQQMLDLMRRTI